MLQERISDPAHQHQYITVAVNTLVPIVRVELHSLGLGVSVSSPVALISTELHSYAGINLTGYHPPGHPGAFAPKCVPSPRAFAQQKMPRDRTNKFMMSLGPGICISIKIVKVHITPLTKFRPENPCGVKRSHTKNFWNRTWRFLTIKLF